jgi:pimeloyl-ACP methyl ester carboxylesterase
VRGRGPRHTAPRWSRPDSGSACSRPTDQVFRGSTPDPELTLQRGADAITDLIDRLEIERVSVLAPSLGAPFALAQAHRHPDRLDGLGLVGPIGPLDVEGACEGMDRLTRMLLLLARRAPLVLEGIFRSIRWQVDRDPEKAAERFTRLRPECDQLVMRRPDVWPLLVDHFPEMWVSPTAARREFATVSRPWGFDLEGIEVPTTIWATETDTVHPPAMARELAERIPGARLVLEAEGGVFSFLDRTEEILHTVAPDARSTVDDHGI